MEKLISNVTIKKSEGKYEIKILQLENKDYVVAVYLDNEEIEYTAGTPELKIAEKAQEYHSKLINEWKGL